MVERSSVKAVAGVRFSSGTPHKNTRVMLVFLLCTRQVLTIYILVLFLMKTPHYREMKILFVVLLDTITTAAFVFMANVF